MDSYTKYDEILSEYRASLPGGLFGFNFWGDSVEPNLSYDLLSALLAKSISDGDVACSGGLAKALDMWVAEELRLAGFEEDAIWPRVGEPRVVDPAVIDFIEQLPSKLHSECMAKIGKAGSANANVRGAVYDKQIDVGMSSWLTGPEILISTKTMSGSFGKNLANRFEEAYGDAMNLRKRYPLAAIGFVFLVNAEILSESNSFVKAAAMLKKLQEDDVYDASALLLYDDSCSSNLLSDENNQIPDDLKAESFFRKIIFRVLTIGSLSIHSSAREKIGADLIEV